MQKLPIIVIVRTFFAKFFAKILPRNKPRIVITIVEGMVVVEPSVADVFMTYSR